MIIHLQKMKKDCTDWSVMDYDYTKTYPDIDYSEKVTEPGLVLSMRQIYERYAAQGIDLLHGDLVEDDDADEVFEDFAPDDDLDVLAHAKLLERIGGERQRVVKHSANKTDKASKKPSDLDDEGSEAAEHSDSGEKEPEEHK